MQYVMQCSHFLVFVFPMSIDHKSIVFIVKDLVGVTFIVLVISRLDCI